MTGQRPRKRFGQNFLHDKNIIHRIIAGIAPDKHDHFVEIGPGHGAITQHLARLSGRLDVIEIDRDLAGALAEKPWFQSANTKLHVADALKFDFSSLPLDTGTMRLAGNLPYNISTPLMFHLLSSHALFSDMHVMLQKEVVERMAAMPGSKTYGRLTVALAARCQVEPLFSIGPGAFTPAPKVESAFVRLVPLASPLIQDNELASFDAILRAAFGKRRKQLGNALQSLLEPAAIRGAGIDPTVRAETLGVEDFIALARLLPPQNTG